jgi:hypothetical protein
LSFGSLIELTQFSKIKKEKKFSSGPVLTWVRTVGPILKLVITFGGTN